MDETRWRLLDGHGRDAGEATNWQAWAVSCPTGIAYRIQGSRSTDAARALIGDYAGTVMSRYDAGAMDLRPFPSVVRDAPARSGPDRMLVVDDDELILKALSRILEAAGYAPRCHVRPEDALALGEEDAPVVIISDYMMGSHK